MLDKNELTIRYSRTKGNCCKCGCELEDFTGQGLGAIFVLDTDGNFYCMNCDRGFDDGDERIFDLEKSKEEFPFEDFCERTIIGIEPGDDEGEKNVHFYGYGYFAYEETEKPYRFVEYGFFVVPLEEVIEVGFDSYEDSFGCEYKQYIEDCTKEEMNNIYKHYDNGNPPKIINEEDITEDIPCGCYIVNYKNEE